MAWYLYIVGIFVAFTMRAALNQDEFEEGRGPVLFLIVGSLLWPVVFPALFAGGILSLVLRVTDEQE